MKAFFFGQILALPSFQIIVWLDFSLSNFNSLILTSYLEEMHQHS